MIKNEDLVVGEVYLCWWNFGAIEPDKRYFVKFCGFDNHGDTTWSYGTGFKLYPKDKYKSINPDNTGTMMPIRKADYNTDPVFDPDKQQTFNNLGIKVEPLPEPIRYINRASI